MLKTKKKQVAIKKTQTHEKDTGSADVQIAVLSERIEELAKHLKKNHKDNHSRRGLLRMVADRRKHMAYLQRKDPKRYATVAKKLGLKTAKKTK
jgi:small subunit ribosomal protein S15